MLLDQELKNRIAILETELRHEKNRGQVSQYPQYCYYCQCYQYPQKRIINTITILSIVNILSIDNNINSYLKYWSCPQVDLSSLDSKLQGEYEARLKAEVLTRDKTKIQISVCHMSYA